jgi:glycosyltransferase involved in cell wall biosynthesis
VHIAIVIPAYNAAEFVPDAIRSVLAQTHTDWSLVVIDDGSTDATSVVASAFCDDRISLIQQQNAGVSAARNAGIATPASSPAVVAASSPGLVAVSSPGLARPLTTCDAQPDKAMDRQAKADAILFLDADDWLAANALACLAAALDSAPQAVAAVGRFARVGPDAIVRTASPPPQGDLLERLLTRNLFANGGHLLIRRNAVEGAGKFRTDLSYGEDWEYWTRLALIGEFVSVPSPAPVLFVRERLTGAYLSHATDPAAYRPAVEAIHRNPAFAQRLGATRIAALAQQAEAEIAWTVGRELIRNGRNRDGRHWLCQSIRRAPSPKRLALLGLGWLRLGRFRPYQMVALTTKR